MAVYYVDLDLAAGLNDGSDWNNAFQTLADAFPGSAGDVFYLRGSESSASSISLDFGGTPSSPVLIHGCLPTAVGTPPSTAELIPGWRTGETRTEANKAAYDPDIPTISTTAGNRDISFDGSAYLYGVKIDSYRAMVWAAASHWMKFDECYLEANHQSGTYEITFGFSNSQTTYSWICQVLNCVLDLQVDSAGIKYIPGTEFINTSLSSSMVTNTSGVFRTERGGRFVGCDLSAAAHTLFNIGSGSGSDIDPCILDRCQLHASSTLATGTASAGYNIVLNQSVPGLSGQSARIVDLASYSLNGQILADDTVYRSGGASDGDSSYSLAFTPNMDQTLENYIALIGPRMGVDVAGDGTTKTATVYINNDSGADFNDDDVWLEVTYNSSTGDSLAETKSGQMELLGTPSSSNSVISDDASSWTASPSLTQAQKLTIDIDPDYAGRVECRVYFAKAYASSPATLYVDPQPVVS